jgi:hypothetical protein
VVLEASLRGRRAIGFDVDPYAALVANAKCRPPTLKEFVKVAGALHKKFSLMQRSPKVYGLLSKSDISKREFKKSSKRLRLPPLPRIDHWFKLYVLVDLARIWRAITQEHKNAPLNRFLVTSFASILRLCSNADPDTLSGIEVTKRMRKWLERGRYIDPFNLFAKRIDRNSRLIEDFWSRFSRDSKAAKARVYKGSALLRKNYRMKRESVHLVVTSPPYCSAIEYDRRHKFEHYWLGFLRNKQDVSKLKTLYVGRRHHIYGTAEDLAQELPGAARDQLLYALRNTLAHENERARAIVQYFLDMRRWFETVSDYMAKGAHLVLVVGDSTVRGSPIPTSTILTKLAPQALTFQNKFSYVLRNRSMQYSRWNEANVAIENVLVFSKRI